MTKENNSEGFSLEDWELLCSKIEFLNVFVAESFKAEQAEAVANRFLGFDSPLIPRRWGTGGVLRD